MMKGDTSSHRDFGKDVGDGGCGMQGCGHAAEISSLVVGREVEAGGRRCVDITRRSITRLQT